MPTYEYRCRACGDTFERRVPADAADDVRCPDGHDDVKRLLSVFAGGRRASQPAPSGGGGGGGCCGGACGCG